MKKYAARLLAAAMLLTVFTGLLTGCASGSWKGEWNRTGDATYSRAIMKIYDVKRSGFTFDMTLYNGNAVGNLRGLRADFTDRACTEAVYNVPNTHATLTFTLNGDGSVDVFYLGGRLTDDYDAQYYSTNGRITAEFIMETEAFGFADTAYITGNFVRTEVEYINSSFAAIGMLSEEDDLKIRKIMPDDMYTRCLDCFQFWKQWQHPKTEDLHDDELGAFLYYGTNQMQPDKAGIMAIFDDGSVAVLLSREDGSLVYYCDNHIYGTGEVYPLQMQVWMEEYYED